jgi:hypothetical protein
MTTQPRKYLIRGTARIGIELYREGDSLTLWVTEPHWPFPSIETHQRSALCWLAGEPEPDVEAARSRVAATLGEEVKLPC